MAVVVQPLVFRAGKFYVERSNLPLFKILWAISLLFLEGGIFGYRKKKTIRKRKDKETKKGKKKKKKKKST